MIHLTVLDELRKVQPETLTAGQLVGRLSGEETLVARGEVLGALQQLQVTGMVEELGGAGDGPSEWRAL